MVYQTPYSKKEEYRRYLQKTGVVDALTKVLIGLYEEPDRPQNAIDYVKRYLGPPAMNNNADSLLKKENEELKAQIKEMTDTINKLTMKLNELSPDSIEDTLSEA